MQEGTKLLQDCEEAQSQVSCVQCKSGHIDMVAPLGTGFEPLTEYFVAVSVARCPAGLVSKVLGIIGGDRY